jgi:hypothetical protein
MTHKQDSKGGLRAAYTRRRLENAEQRIAVGPTGVFIRVTLAIILMHLIVVSYLMMGISGPVFVSILFLLAHFAPFLYRAAKAFMERRKPQGATRALDAETQQEG